MKESMSWRVLALVGVMVCFAENSKAELSVQGLQIVAEKGLDSAKIIAHRGLWSDTVAQNSIPGINDALQTNSGGYECDIRQTADGQLVLNHDMDFHGKDIDKFTLQELRNGDLTMPPLLVDVLELQKNYPDKVMYAEVKSGDVADIVTAFVDAGVTENVIFKSFDRGLCDSLISIAPSPVYLLSSSSNLDYEALRDAGFSGVSLMYEEGTTSPALIQKIHNAGLNCAFWTITDSNIASNLIEWGADHIVSDVNLIK